MKAHRSRTGVPYAWKPRSRVAIRRWPSRHVVRDHTICLMYRLGVTQSALADAWGLSQMRVSQIIAKDGKA